MKNKAELTGGIGSRPDAGMLFSNWKSIKKIVGLLHV
jgi:hypothetical protein